jgi:hypothetical protein
MAASFCQDMSNTKDDAVAEIINLRRVKRRVAREDSAQAAQENRVRHGRTKVEAHADKRDEERRIALVDGARLEPSSKP